MPEAQNILSPEQAPGMQPGVEDESGLTGSATPPAGGTTVVIQYVTLPLQIGVPVQPGLPASRIDWKQFATSPQLVLCLADANGVPLNVTGATVRLRLAPVLGGGGVVSEPMTTLYAVGGQVGYTFTDADVEIDGTFALEVEVVQASGVYMYLPTSGTLLFVIHASLGGP